MCWDRAETKKQEIRDEEWQPEVTLPQFHPEDPDLVVTPEREAEPERERELTTV